MALTDIIAGFYSGVSTLLGVPSQPDALAVYLQEKKQHKNAMNRLLFFLGATTIGLSGCEWPGVNDYDGYDGYTPYPRIESVSHTPQPAFINQNINLTVTFYSSLNTTYSGSLSYDTDGDGSFDDSSYVSYPSPGQKSVTIRATRNSSTSQRIYHFTVYDDIPQFRSVSLDGVAAHEQFFAPSETAQLTFDIFDDEGITSLEYRVEEWDGSSYLPHTPDTPTTQDETITLPSNEGQYRYTLVAEDTDSNVNTTEFITHVIDPTVTPTGSFEHQKDGSVTYDIIWGDLDTIIGNGEWSVQLYSDGSPLAMYQSPNVGITLPLYFVGDLSVAIGKKQPDDSYRYTEQIPMGLTGTNTEPYPVNGPSGTITDTPGATFTLNLTTVESGGKKDPNGDFITYQSETLPAWLELNQTTGAFTVTSAPSGTYPLEFWTEDEYGADNYSSRYTIVFQFF